MVRDVRGCSSSLTDTLSTGICDSGQQLDNSQDLKVGASEVDCSSVSECATTGSLVTHLYCF